MFATVTAIVASITISQIALAATVVGTALSIAGTLTNNSTLKWIGVGIGAAGALTGLAGAAGLFDASTTLGSVFGGSSSSAAQAASTVGQVAPAVTTPVTPAVQPAIDAASGVPLAQYSTAAGPGMIGTPGAAEVAQLGQQAAAAGTQAASSASSAVPPGFQMTEQGMVHVGTPAVDAASQAGQVGTQISTGSATVAPSVVAPSALTAPTAPIANAMSTGSAGNLAGTVDSLNKASNLTEAFKSLDPATKIALTMAAGQTVAGGLGGVFSSMSANKQIELQKLIAEQRNNIDSQTLQQRSRMLDMEQTKLDRATASPGIISFGG